MRIRTVDRDPDFPAELKASFEQILPKLAEEIESGDYTDIALKRCLASAYAVITFVDPDTIREYNREERGIYQLAVIDIEDRKRQAVSYLIYPALFPVIFPDSIRIDNSYNGIST